MFSTYPQEVSGLFDHGFVEGIPLMEYIREPKLSVTPELTPAISPARLRVTPYNSAGTLPTVIAIGPASNLLILIP
jgi:hypothetical protein